MDIEAIIHEDETGGYWAEVPALPGCATQGETLDELLFNLREAIEGVMFVETENAASERKGPARRQQTLNVQYRIARSL